jgi:hypothetical protein
MAVSTVVPPWQGLVTLEAYDAATGALLERIVTPNTYTQAAALAYANALASGTAIPLKLSHIDVGTGGYMVSNANSTSGWSGSPTLDTSVYKEGTGALNGTVVAPGTAHFYHATSYGGTVTMGTGGSMSAWLRLTSRAAANLTSSKLRFYAYGGTANYIEMTLANVETVGGVTLADLTWTQAVLPTSHASWATAGTATWQTITGMGVVLVGASGTATIHWDQVLGMPAYSAADRVNWSATVGSRGLNAITTGPTTAGGTVVAAAGWVEGDIVGDMAYAGLYANSGSTLFAVAPLAYYKAAGVVISLTWTVVCAGG